VTIYDKNFRISILINYDPTRNHRKLYMMYTTGSDRMFSVEYGRIGNKLTINRYNIKEWESRYSQKVNGKGYTDVWAPPPFCPVMLKNTSNDLPGCEGKNGIILPRYVIKDNDRLLRNPSDALFTEVMLTNTKRVRIPVSMMVTPDSSFLTNPTTLRQGFFKQFYEKIEEYKGHLPLILWD